MVNLPVVHTKTASTPGPARRFLIRLNLPIEEQDDCWELCRDIQKLGGASVSDGFQFVDRDHRDEAMDVLIHTWARWYLDPVNTDETVSPR